VTVRFTRKNTPSAAVEYNFLRLSPKNGRKMKSLIPASLVVIGHSIVDWWDGWIIMILMTILWLLCQITVILGPPATFGLYYAVHEMLGGVSVGVPEMILAGRKYFKQAWIWGAFNLIVLFIFMTAFRFYISIQTWWGNALQILVMILAFLYLSSVFYGLPYFIELEPKSLRVALQNGLYTTLAAPFFTLILFTSTALILGVSLLLILPIFLGFPAVIPILGFHALDNRIAAFGLRKAEPP
jgi:hypothetical protein